MDLFLVLKLLLMGAFIILTLVAAYFVVELIRILIRVRKISDRFLILTDMKEWFNFFRFFQKTTRRK